MKNYRMTRSSLDGQRGKSIDPACKAQRGGVAGNVLEGQLLGPVRVWGCRGEGLDEAHSLDRYHSSEHCGDALSPEGLQTGGVPGRSTQQRGVDGTRRLAGAAESTMMPTFLA